MKIFLLSMLLSVIAGNTFAQKIETGKQLKGIVDDSVSHQNLGFVTLTLKTGLMNQPPKSVLTKENGSFEFNKLSGNSYHLIISAVGYQQKILIINSALLIPNIADLGTIHLMPSINELKAVSVTASKAVVKQEIDRLIYDVQADPDSKSLTAIDMLRKVPMITVDGDDNIQLQGSGSYRIFINGKPSAMMTNNPKDVLRSMPANTIQKIEVITTPPAKYDSEGLAGIINIITTKNTADGYNGTVSSRYNYPWGPNINLTGTYKHDKFGVSGYVGTGRQTSVTIHNSNYKETYAPFASQLLQNGTKSYGGNFLYGSTDISYEADTLNLFTASLNYNNGRFDQNYDLFTQFTSVLPTTPPQAYRLQNEGGFNWRGLDAGLNYQLGFKHNKNQLLTSSYRYSYSLNGQRSDITTSDRLNYHTPDYNQQNDAFSKEHTLQLDYIQPLKRLTIEAGAKGIFRTNSSNSAAQNLSVLNGQSVYIEDVGRTNNFIYHQNILSAYNSYTFKFTSWTIKAGARLEHTHVNANFITNNSYLDMDYSNLIPSISLQRIFKSNQSITFGFTNRLERPGIGQLNPYIDKSNPQIISTGNPNLRPVLSHLLELNYAKTGNSTYNFKISYFYTGNSIQNVIRLLSDTLSETTYANVGTNRIARLDFNDSFNLTNKLSITVNTGIFYVWLSGYDNGQLYRNQGPRTNTFASSSYKPGKDWQFSLSGGYNRRYITLQGSSRDYAYMYMSAAKTFNKMLTITTTVNNPFQRFYAFTNYSNTDQFYQSNTTNNYYRTFNISLSYKFGKLSTDIKKNQRTISNDDKSSGAN